MSQASEYIARQMATGANVAKIWGDVLFNVKDTAYAGGAVGNGTTDDTAAIQATIDYALSVGGKSIFFPHGTYQVTALANLSSVVLFGDNASFIGISTIINQIGSPTSNLAINVKDYGAKGDNTTDDTAAVQTAINYAMGVGSNVYFPKGVYKISSTLLMDRNIAGRQERISLLGDGAGLSTINYTGSGICLDIRGTLSTSQAFGTQGLASYQNIRDLGFNGNGYLGTAIKTTNNNTFKMTNVKIFGFDLGMWHVDMENSNFDNIHVSWCQKGALFEQQTPFIAAYSTRPNTINFYGCSVGSCLQYGIHVKGGVLFNWFGGAISNNGYNNPQTLSNTSWGLRIEEAGYQGGVGCNVIGAYLESNAGIADIWLDNRATNAPVINDATYVISGCSFNRAGSDYYTRNNICCTFGASAGKQKLLLTGSSFKYFGTYVEDASRKNVNFDGAVLSPTKNNFESIGCIFKSAIEGLVLDTMAKPYGEVSKAVPQTIPTAAWTKWGIDTNLTSKNWASTLLDTVNNKVTIPETGVYALSADIIFPASATGKRGVRIVHSVNGTIASNLVSPDSADFNLSVSITRKMDASSLVWVEVFQDSGVSLDIKGANLYFTNLSITKLVDI